MSTMARRFAAWSIVALLAWSGSAMAQFGNPFEALKELDPTNKNSTVAKATGYTFNPGALLPRPRPSTGAVFTDPEPEPVNYTIDRHTGDVYASTRSRPQPQRTGIKAHVENRNGQRYWVYGPVRQPIPNDVDVDAQGVRHVFDGTDIVIENATPQRLAFKAHFEPSSSPGGALTFNDLHTLDPGQKAIWHVRPNETVRSMLQNGRQLCRIQFEGFDPSSGQKVGDWGPNGTAVGLAPNQDGLVYRPQQNGVIHQHRTLVFRLSP